MYFWESGFVSKTKLDFTGALDVPAKTVLDQQETVPLIFQHIDRRWTYFSTCVALTFEPMVTNFIVE